MTRYHLFCALAALLALSACGGSQESVPAGTELWVELEAEGAARAAAGVGGVEIISAGAAGQASLRASYIIGKPVAPTVRVTHGCAEFALFKLWRREVCAGDAE